MILHGSKPSTRHCFHNPQVTNCKSTGETALVSFVQELSHVGKRALFISGSPAFKFINMLFLTSCETVFCATVKKGFSLLRFLVAKVIHSFSRLFSSVVVLKYSQAIRQSTYRSCRMIRKATLWHLGAQNRLT